MYVDAENLYSEAQAITASAASTNLIDHSEPRDLGTGEDIYLFVCVKTAFTDAGSDSTVTVAIETDDNSGFSSAVTAQTIGTFAALSAAGTVLIAKLQPGPINEQFSRLQYTVANGNLTTGAVTAFLTVNVEKYVAYPDNITIS